MSTTTERITLNTGTVLPNEWTVVDAWHDHSREQIGDERPQGVVLAMYTSKYDKFATWDFIFNGYFWATFTGHYHSGIFPAAKDFARRVSRSGGEA